jgi:hypothetical protein
VCQEEEPAAAVGRAHIRSSKGDDGSGVAMLGELGEDGGKSASCSTDVLPEEERGFAFVGDSDLLEEEPASLAVEPGLLAGDAEVLARRSASDAIHEATPRAAVEGAEVVPNRGLAQGLLRHPGHEAGRCVGFPLDVHHSAGDSAGGSLESEVEASSAGADAEHVEGTWSHIHFAAFLARTLASRCALASRSNLRVASMGLPSSMASASVLSVDATGIDVRLAALRRCVRAALSARLARRRWRELASRFTATPFERLLPPRGS